MFGADVATREVGLPLLVHRRCQNPMFDISNRIACDGQVVYPAVPTPDGRVRAAIGPFGWHDVDGSADSKWCPEEGERVVDMCDNLLQPASISRMSMSLLPSGSWLLRCASALQPNRICSVPSA